MAHHDIIITQGSNTWTLTNDGDPWVITRFNPWSTPEYRNSDAPRPQANGVFSGVDYLDGRLVVIEGVICALSREEALGLRHELARAFAPTGQDVTLQFGMDSVVYQMTGRPRGVEFDTRMFHTGHMPFVARFLATDPLVYSDFLASVLILESTGEGGAPWPWVWPVDWSLSGSAAPGVGTLVNSGLAPARWTATIVAGATPLEGLAIEHVEQSRLLAFEGFTMNPGETLVIDATPGLQSVKLNGTDRYGEMTTRQWFLLNPGTNTLRLSASSVPGGATMTVQWRSAYY